MTYLLQMNAWKKLKTHCETYYEGFCQSMSFEVVLSKPEKQVVSTPGITLDYSEQCLDHMALGLLFELAEECQVKKMIHALMTGDNVNESHHIPALHTALRASSHEKIRVDGQDVVPDVFATREQMKSLSEAIRSGRWLGYSGQPITDVVNVGIGGSFLGALLCITALNDVVTETLGFHYISDIDPHSFHRVIKKLKPETTLFIIASKSFETQETLWNMKKAMAWINQPQHIDRHFIAVTEWINKPSQYGINHILPIWKWVGGRYSSCSAINLMTCIAIGYEQFLEFLEGAHAMDEHFWGTPLTDNLPVILALLGVWNSNFLGINNLLVLTYSLYLQHFIPYLQQLDMESNGKSVDKEGHPVQYATGPIVWGGLGNQAQHSYYQLLCQGTRRIVADLISVNVFDDQIINHLCYAHKTVLSNGQHNANDLVSVKIPINQIFLKDCSPNTLGQLIALYEHKIFVQSVIWHINPFDQPGVDSSKEIVWQKNWENQ